MCRFMPYISPHGGSIEQQLGTDAEPPHSSELCPPEQPCWRDQWLSKMTETQSYHLHCDAGEE